MQSLLSENHINTCIALFNARKYAQAKQGFEEVLNVKPEHALASMYYCQSLVHLNQLEDAYKYLTQDCSVHECQLWYWQCAALICNRKGDHEKELTAIQACIKLTNNSADLSRRLFELLLLTRRYHQAQHYINHQANQHNITDEAINTLWLKYAKSREYYLEAVDFAKKLVNAKPTSNYFLHEYAIALRLNGVPEEALPIFKQLLQKKPHFAIYHNLANCYSDLGDYAQAIANYRQAIKLNPLYSDSHINLNKMLWESGLKKDYLVSFETVIKAHPKAYHLRLSFAHFLVDAKLYARALTLLDSAPLPEPFAQQQLQLQGLALRLQGDSDRAIQYFNTLLIKQPDAFEIKLEHAIAQISNRDFSQARAALEMLAEQQPANQTIKAYRYAAMRLADEQPAPIAPQIRSINLCDRLPADFWQQLATELHQIHNATAQPIGQTLENGSQTRGHLFSSRHPCITRLKNVLNEKLLAYCQTHEVPLESVLNTRDTINYTGSWSVRLRQAGFHHDHFHSRGTLSGVIYIALPAEVTDQQNRAGWLKFGAPYLNETLSLPAEYFIQPAVGTCVIFPSHIWHGTTPIEANAERLTIAFDVGRYGLPATDS